MTKLTIDKFASSTFRLGLSNPVEITRDCVSESGTVVVVRALTENPNYPDLELVDGRIERIRAGDVIAGVLGSRRALRGFVGYSPYKLAAGDRLNLLNLGGVIGRCIDGHKDLGEAVQVEVLGCAVRRKTVLNLDQAALAPMPLISITKPVVLVVGSCMNVGKTAAAAEIIRRFTLAGRRVGAAKLSGIACLKDLRRFEAAGAVKVLSFLDAGVPSTVDAEDPGAIARTVMGHLEAAPVDVIVLELGDGILGHYGVERVLDDTAVTGSVTATVYCASDLVSAWGGIELFARRGLAIDVVSGPATDNASGTTWIDGTLNVRAANALTEGAKLVEILQAKMGVPA
ncbi:MAG TPA: hypothetical protein VJU16_00875 [Planctomycetota bacterium]|nr:hypothetical protein [Planctomycetota bacterium]